MTTSRHLEQSITESLRVFPAGVQIGNTYPDGSALALARGNLPSIYGQELTTASRRLFSSIIAFCHALENRNQRNSWMAQRDPRNFGRV